MKDSPFTKIFMNVPERGPLALLRDSAVALFYRPVMIAEEMITELGSLTAMEMMSNTAIEDRIQN